MYEQETPSEPLRKKLDRLLTIPFVNNRASARGVRPLKPQTAKLGRHLRVALWNIERGLEYEAIESAFTDPARFSSLLNRSKYPRGSRQRAEVLQQVKLMQEADVVVLNEVDWGLKRTGYRNVVEDLASALRMNYAYGVEFVEIDPISLGIEKFEGTEPEERADFIEQTKVDTSRYKGLHGTAILSRFPLENVRLIPFKFQPHDWYEDEKKGATRIEKGKRKASEVAFLEKAYREVRRGGRMMLLADIVDQEIPEGRMTIVATHLEAKTKPGNRVKQLEELLAQIKEIKHTVVVVGDMNTSTRDATPTSIRREIKKRLGSKKFWVKSVLKYGLGFDLPYRLAALGLNEYRKQADPTVRSIPLVASNPEAKFFDVLRDFRFTDGGAFDFRGERARSIGDSTETLANSNERGGKGFVTTYEVERTLGFAGKFKLDWLFVKPPALTEPYGTQQPYRFAPHFGRTLKALNQSIEDRISDHEPLTVDLPLAEPRIR
ncbi:MAG TPA: endonuclease/exonuclease/phosphatase family protein [Pyrinomonadaceae bacterium]|nr:endonuclease/exonuclease/phosphatase family protein [Pyrinomonadaceae bacterium]